MIDTLRAILAGPAASPFVKSLGLEVVGASPDEVILSLPVVPYLVYGEGALCGQAIMVAMDFAMVLAVVANAGGKYRPMTTVQLQTSFLRRVPAHVGEVKLAARVLRVGARLAFGEFLLTTPDGRLAAHGTTTYAFLAERSASAGR
jgi:uncharacterized protein (TIGR00369 family)